MTRAAIPVLLTLGLSVGCSSLKDNGFGTGGNRYTPSNDSGGDSGDTGTNEDAPVITAIRAEFTDYPSYGIVLELGMFIEDPQDDLDGGKVIAAVSNGDTQYDYEEAIGGENVSIQDDGEFLMVSADPDSTLDWTLVVRVQDVEGNASSVEQLVADPYSE